MSVFEQKYKSLCWIMLDEGEPVETHWQAMRDVPQNKTVELHDFTWRYQMPETYVAADVEINPTRPWAEDHFQERVSRVPHNPPPSAAYWAKKGVDEHRDEQGRFSHTYPERFWPKTAYDGNANPGGLHDDFDRMFGIRYPYGDLDDVVSLLAREPHTRQSYLPVWFPEDTGAVPGERVPCTLGYHFILRRGQLHCFYPMRSCDLLRHFRNDVYMAVRLTQWILEQLAEGYSSENWRWADTTPGLLTMHMVSLHVFEPDIPVLEHKYG
jgi:thymidylate synthase